MGRKLLLVFSFIFSLLLLVGCGNGSDEKNNSEIPFEPDFKYFPPVRDVFEMAKNVYEAELVELKENTEYEYSKYATVNFQGDYKIKVKIKFVYKGDYLPGEDIVEDTVLFNYPDCINVGSTYLFMTGIDEDYLEADKDKLNLYYDSRVHVIEILNDGMFDLPVLYHDEYRELEIYHFFGRKKYSTYYEILYDMLNVEDLVSIYTLYFWDLIPHKKDDNMNVIFKSMYDSADNAYIGDVVEIQEYGWSYIILGENNIGYYCPTTKIKVKVSRVIKGEYVPGQIVEDIIPLEYSAAERHCKNLICISGDDFFAYYEEMLSGEKSMREVSSMLFSGDDFF